MGGGKGLSQQIRFKKGKIDKNDSHEINYSEYDKRLIYNIMLI